MSLFTFANFKKAIKNPLQAILYLIRGFQTHYSQAGEDIILNRMNLNEKGLYIDIGANHPIHSNNTYLFYKRGWRGINIEPNKEMIKKFKSARSKDINLQIAIGKSYEELTFHVFKEHQMCTCDLDTVKRYEKTGSNVINKYTVPIWTLEMVCDKYVKNRQIDILSVDVEGWDMNVLESNNWEKYKPKFIILETVEYGTNGKNTRTKQNNIFDPYLTNKGYSVIAETGINTIYKLQ